MSHVHGPVCIRSLNMRPPQEHFAFNGLNVGAIVGIVVTAGAIVVDTASHSITDLIAYPQSIGQVIF